MADLLGMNHSTYAAYEDAKKYKKPILPLDLAKRIAAVLESHGIEQHEVLQLAGLTGGGSGAAHVKDRLIVEGAVAAGVWRENTEWPLDQRYEIEVGPNPMPGCERFAVRMEGLSMNLTIPPFSDLECLRVFGQIQPRPGDLVIVQRQAHDLIEMTCKRLDIDGEEWILRCESTEPEFQDAIRIGKPEEGLHVDNEISVVGIVISSQQNHLRNRRF